MKRRKKERVNILTNELSKAYFASGVPIQSQSSRHRFLKRVGSSVLAIICCNNFANESTVKIYELHIFGLRIKAKDFSPFQTHTFHFPASRIVLQKIYKNLHVAPNWFDCSVGGAPAQLASPTS